MAFVVAPGMPTASWIRPGWRWEGGTGWNKVPDVHEAHSTFQAPADAGGRSPASSETLRRWQTDEYKFPPYQYGPQFLLTHSSEPARLLDSSERELLLGFGAGHTNTCLSASEAKQSLTRFEDVRKSLCGDSFAILSFAIMASQMSELLPRMSPSKIVARLGLAPGASAHPEADAPISRWLHYDGSGEPTTGAALQLVQHLGLTVNHTGCDVRVNRGHIMGHKYPAHGSVRAWWWQWRHLFEIRWTKSIHINFLEMQMIFTNF